MIRVSSAVNRESTRSVPRSSRTISAPLTSRRSRPASRSSRHGSIRRANVVAGTTRPAAFAAQVPGFRFRSRSGWSNTPSLSRSARAAPGLPPHRQQRRPVHAWPDRDPAGGHGPRARPPRLVGFSEMPQKPATKGEGPRSLTAGPHGGLCCVCVGSATARRRRGRAAARGLRRRAACAGRRLGAGGCARG